MSADATPSAIDRACWFAEHVQSHESALRRWLHSRFGSECEVDDLVQETYARLLRLPRYDRVASPKAFLFTTARNVALDRLRRRQAAQRAGLVEMDLPDVIEEGASIPETIARNQERDLLHEAIQSLPDRCRQIFLLRKIQGVSQAEIAARLRISECTVSAQLSIGLKKCSEFLAWRCREAEEWR